MLLHTKKKGIQREKLRVAFIMKQPEEMFLSLQEKLENLKVSKMQE